MTMVNDIVMAWGETPPEAILRLRSLLRTPDETAVLVQAVQFREVRRLGSLGTWEARKLDMAVDAMTIERRDELMREASSG